MNPLGLERKPAFHALFVALFVLAFYQFFVIIEPFLTPLLGAMVLAIVAFPIHRGVCRRLPRLNRNSQAALSTLAILVLIVVPFAILIGLLLNESDIIVPMAQKAATQFRIWYEIHGQTWIDRIAPLAQRITNLGRVGGEDLQKATSLLSGVIVAKVSALGKSVATNTLLTAFNLFIMAFALFFLLRDGERALSRLKKWLPMESKEKDRILSHIEDTILGVVRGSVLTALFQAACATLGYLIVGIPAAVTLGLLTGVASIIPVFGTALVWLPTALYLLVVSSAWKGIFLLVWGGIVVSLTDNLVRTVLIGRRARLPLFLLFLGIVGGMRVYGLRGLLMGPLLVSILPVLIDIFESQYLSEK